MNLKEFANKPGALNMQLSNYTTTQQNSFANYCRTENLQQIDGLTNNRIHHYRRLIRGVIDDSLRAAYPLTENLLSDEEWILLVDEFISNHNCQSPQIWQMPYEFYTFIEENDLELKTKYPFLIDLLLFEWKEIEIYMMEDLNDEEYCDPSFNEKSKIIFNKEFEILKLDYPVHLKSVNEINPEDKLEYFVLIFRYNDKVQFYDLSSFFVWMISEILSGNNIIKNINTSAVSLFNNYDEEIIKINISQFIRSMQQKGFILGFTNEY